MATAEQIFLDLPPELKSRAEAQAEAEGRSLQELIVDALAVLLADRSRDEGEGVVESVGASGELIPRLADSGIRVETIGVAATGWGWTPRRIAEEYDLTVPQVEAALAYWRRHRRQLEAAVTRTEELEAAHG